MRELPQKRYLADGVYASYDGYHLWLETQEGNKIALDSETWMALLRYVEYVKECNKKPNLPEMK